jgi:Ni/Co efflux regulator RcnB
MRFPLLATLLLSAAAPAVAAAEPDPGQRVESRAAEREARREERAQRFERAEPVRAERAQPRFERPEPREMPAPRMERPAPALERPPVPVSVERRDSPEPMRERRREWSAPAEQQAPQPPQARQGDSVANWRYQQRENARRDRRDRDGRPVADAVVQPPLVPRVVPPTEPQRTERRPTFDVLKDRIAAEGWRKDWRRDRRYDWRHHRDRDRNRFRLGIYIDPFGWRYRPWQLGWNLPSRYYGSSYWIDDPWAYRLPPVYGPYRWIRYYDDVLLIDLRTGRVVDRIPNFFW